MRNVVERSGKAGGWKSTLAEVLREHNGRKARNGSVASYATQQKRSEQLFRGFECLRELGYRLDTVRSLRSKHVEVLVQDWLSRKLSASVIQNNLSIFRVFSGWIGKKGMVERSSKYVGNLARRSGVSTKDKSWSAAGVDTAEIIRLVARKDPRVAIQLELQAAFGLRVREAIQLRPYLADKGGYLAVTLGTKGGRDRTVPIISDLQRDVLLRAQAMAGKTTSTADPSMRLDQWKNHYYYIVRSAGVSRNRGITSHGLRHERLNEVYRETAGIPSPVQGGDTRSIPRDLHDQARHEVVEVAGHSAVYKASPYIGSAVLPRAAKNSKR